ncbi:MAG: substrate-binding domain-containing protein [Planctomycetaceae bacterium]
MLAVSAAGLTGGLMWLSQPISGANRPLRLYCAAGMRMAVEKIVAKYKAEYGVEIEIQYGGSNTLLSQLQVNNSEDADLYLAADDFYTAQAVELGLALDVYPIAYSGPVIAVPPGNPKQIRNIGDLLRPDVRVAMADPDQAAVGRAVRDRLSRVETREGNFWEQLQASITDRGVFKPTVNDVANDVKLGAVDAGLVWDSTVKLPDYAGSMEELWRRGWRAIPICWSWRR